MKICSSKIIKVSGRLGSHSQVVSPKLADGPTKSGLMDQMGSSGLLQALETHVGEHDDERFQQECTTKAACTVSFGWESSNGPKVQQSTRTEYIEGPGGFVFKFFASSPSKLPFSMKAVSSQGND
jgi:hypothetical protein